MKRLKKCYYLILLVTVGIVYLSTVDQWKVYAQAVEQVKEFCLGTDGQENRKKPEDDIGQETRGKNLQKPENAEAGAGDEAETGGNQSPTASDADDGVQNPETTDADDGGPGQDSANVGDRQGQDTEIIGAGTEENIGSTEQQGEQDVTAEPVYMTVEDEYFSDAVFIGDSRTVGMYEYGGLEDISTFYASTGLTVYKIFDAAIVSVPGQKKKITVEEALQDNSFAKIYLMIGINEMGTGTVETFIEKYREVVEHLQELQPEAVIYIQGIIKVTTERSDQGDYINNEGIEARNRELEKLADNSRIFYLDVNPLICDETGGLVDSYTFDGVHLKAKYIPIWKDYLKENAVQVNFS